MIKKYLMLLLFLTISNHVVALNIKEFNIDNRTNQSVLLTAQGNVILNSSVSFSGIVQLPGFGVRKSNVELLNWPDSMYITVTESPWYGFDQHFDMLYFPPICVVSAELNNDNDAVFNHAKIISYNKNFKCSISKDKNTLYINQNVDEIEVDVDVDDDIYVDIDPDIVDIDSDIFDKKGCRP